MATAVTVTRTNNAEIDGLLGGAKWTGPITYSFPDSPSDYLPGYSTSNEPTTGFARAPSAEQAAMNYAVGLVRSYTNASIQYAGAGSADIQIAQSSAANPTSYAYYPSNAAGGAGGDVWFGTFYDYSQAKLGNYGFSLRCTISATPRLNVFRDGGVAMWRYRPHRRHGIQMTIEGAGAR